MWQLGKNRLTKSFLLTLQSFVWTNLCYSQLEPAGPDQAYGFLWQRSWAFFSSMLALLLPIPPVSPSPSGAIARSLPQAEDRLSTFSSYSRRKHSQGGHLVGLPCLYNPWWQSSCTWPRAAKPSHGASQGSWAEGTAAAYREPGKEAGKLGNEEDVKQAIF